jgi:hypothetical protein
MAATELPADGTCELGAVWLPAGRRIVPVGWDVPDDAAPVAWVTSTDVPDPGPVWSALFDLHPQTGLVPLLIDADGGAEAEHYFFLDPTDPRGIDAASAAAVLAERWWLDPNPERPSWMPPFEARRSTEFLGLHGPGEGANSVQDIVFAMLGMMADPARRAEFDRLNKLDREEEGWPPPMPADARPDETVPFPGMAAAVRERLPVATLTAALAAVPPCRVALVPAARASDVLAVTGWCTTDAYQDPVFGVPVGAVLRSWEERFGARLLRIGPGADATLFVERPPQTPEAALAVANEHWAFADEFNGEGRLDIATLAERLTGSPLWTFWWD